MAFFSFLIPVYNAEKYLPELFDSILIQNIDDYEIIALNDGSKDDSLAVCQKYREKYPDKIHVISRENKGAVRTRRELLEASSGEWIWIIDSDDYIDPHALDDLSIYLQNEAYDMILFDYYHMKKDKKVLFHQIESEEPCVFKEENKKVLYRKLITSWELNALWNKVFRRSCVDWDENYQKYEDVRRANDKLQCIPLVTNAEIVLYIPKPLYYYRYVEGSLVNVYRDYTYPSLKKVNERLVKYVEIWGLESEFMGNVLDLKRSFFISSIKNYAVSPDIKCTADEFSSFADSLKSDLYFKEILENTKEVLLKDKIVLDNVKKRNYKVLFYWLKVRHGLSSIIRLLGRNT